MAIDELSLLMLGRGKQAGCPFHGRVTGASLALPNGQTLSGVFNTQSKAGTSRMSIAGIPAVIRTAEEAAYDAAQGWQWRSDFAVAVSGARELFIYGAVPIACSGFYAAGPGSCWAVSLPFWLNTNAGKTALAEPASLHNASLVGSASAAEIPLEVSLEGYAGTPHSLGNWVPWDTNLDGSRVILGGRLTYAQHGHPAPYRDEGFGLLKLSGKGTNFEPFSASIQKLNGVFEPDNFAFSGGIIGFLGRSGWRWTVEEEWLPASPCSTLKQIWRRSDYVIEAGDVLSATDIPHRYESGDFTLQADDLPEGYWFGSDGQPQAVTTTRRYSCRITYSCSGNGTGAPPNTVTTPHIQSGGSCQPYLANQTSETGIYEWDCFGEYRVVEELETILKVAGVEIDRVLLRFEAEQGQSYVMSNPATSIGAPSGGAQHVWHRRRIFLNGVQEDSAVEEYTEAGQNGWAPLSGWAPTMLATPRTFPAAGAHNDRMYWLLSLFDIEHSIGTGNSFRVSSHLHWYSNRLCCLMVKKRRSPGFRLEDTYRTAAHPNGVVAGSITVSPSGSANAAPRYGVVNPYTGAAEVGLLAPVMII